MRITILGCGTSTGVPVIACPCDVCRSSDPRNRRTRSSIVVAQNGANLLVDTAPDLRFQAMAAGLTHIEAVLYTHDHADHIFGMDELRSFNFAMGRAIPIYGNEKVIRRIQTVYSYIWDPEAPRGGGLPMINPNIIEGPLTLGGIEVVPLPLWHGEQMIFGYRFGGRMAYLTDVSRVPDETLDLCRGLDLVIVDGLRYRPHNTHFSVDEAVEVVMKLGPRRALLTHMSHALEYERLRKELPAGIEPAYDGLEVTLEEGP